MPDQAAVAAENLRSSESRALSRDIWSARWVASGSTGRANGVTPWYYCSCVPVRRKRSISMPPDLDAEIEAAARSAGTTYSGWLAAMARREFVVRAGLEAVAEFEREHGGFSEGERADAEEWAKDAIDRSGRSGTTRRRIA